MDKIIKIAIADRRPTLEGTPVIVCGNGDYKIQFTFDAEWDPTAQKTARFVWVRDGRIEHHNEDFTGDTVAAPVLKDTLQVKVGVYTGELRTTTPAVVPCEPSILCGSGEAAIPTPEQDARILQLLSMAVEQQASAEAAAITSTNAAKEAKEAAASVVGLTGPALSAVNVITIPENADLNTYLTEGNYKIASVSTAQTIANIPHPVGGRLTVYSTNMVGRYIQKFEANTPNASTYLRFYNGTEWNEWARIAYKNELETVEKNAISATGIMVTSSNYEDYFTDYNDIPVNTVYNIGYGVPLLNSPPGNMMLNQVDDTLEYPAGTIVTYSGNSDSPNRPRFQIFSTHNTVVAQSVLCFRSAYTQNNVLYWSPWQKYSEAMAITSSNIVIRAETAHKYFTDLNDVPNNTIYQLDLNCVDGVLANHPFPGVSCVLLTFGFSYISRHGMVQQCFSIPGGEASFAFRYGYKQDEGVFIWTPWKKV